MTLKTVTVLCRNKDLPAHTFEYQIPENPENGFKLNENNQIYHTALHKKQNDTQKIFVITCPVCGTENKIKI
ncbi:MAG: hypothetical protein H5T43_07115 [Methanomethylovorans sp.]|jgi:hypothetical protein|nr:hypothetical protein [Methanomethylovorans sp.]